MSLPLQILVLAVLIYLLKVINKWDKLADCLNDKMHELFPEEKDDDN